MTDISTLANDIFVNELDSTGTSLLAVSGWLDENIGMLNTALYTSFCPESGTISGMGLEERYIYKQMYLSNYYSKQVRNALRGIVDGTHGNIISIKDGDNTIKFASTTEASKIYKSIAQESNKAIEDAVTKYNSFQASPKQVGEEF